MGLGSLAVSAVKGVVSAVSSAFSPIIKDIIEVGVKAFKLTANIVENLAKKLDIIEEDESIENLGDKAIQIENNFENDNFQVEQFEEYDQYMDFINDFELDPEESKEIKSEEKIAKGMEVLVEGIEDKYGIKFKKMLIKIALNPDFYNENRLSKYIKKFSESNLDLDDIIETGNDFNKDKKVMETRLAAEKELNPEMTDDEIFNMLD